MDALRKGNEIRYARAELKRQLAMLPPPEARRWVAGLLVDPPDFVLGMPTVKLLEAIPRAGVRQAANWVSRTSILNGLKRISDLTDRQRIALAELIAGEVPKEVPRISTAPYTFRRQVGTALDPKVHAALERRADEHGRSISAELREIVIHSLNGRAA